LAVFSGAVQNALGVSSFKFTLMSLILKDGNVEAEYIAYDDDSMLAMCEMYELGYSYEEGMCLDDH